jgi:hypothetical protein
MVLTGAVALAGTSMNAFAAAVGRNIGLRGSLLSIKGPSINSRAADASAELSADSASRVCVPA